MQARAFLILINKRLQAVFNLLAQLSSLRYPEWTLSQGKERKKEKRSDSMVKRKDDRRLHDRLQVIGMCAQYQYGYTIRTAVKDQD